MDLITRQNLITRIADAIQRGEKTYYGVELPTPQRTGTSTQQRSYAIGAAERVVNLIY